MHTEAEDANQWFAILTDTGLIERELPPARARVGSGDLRWGRAEEIGSPAYWCAQSWAWQLQEPDHFRLGATLEEEVLACILGGHGMPAEMGLAAYSRLRSEMLRFPATLLDPSAVLALLSEPFVMAGREMRYRFARQRSLCIAGAMAGLPRIDRGAPDRDLRHALIQLPGVGLKTASWVVRNWRGSDEVSILDIHILRAGRSLGIFSGQLTVERHYLSLETAYLQFARDIGARPSVLDSVMWMTMRQLPACMTTDRSSHLAHSLHRRHPRVDRRSADASS